MAKRPHLSMNILTAMSDPALFGKMFSGKSWATWRVVLKALYGLPLSGKETTLYFEITNRRVKPRKAFRELWCVVGRRGGKSRIMALVAVFEAAFKSYRHILSRGERGKVVIVAADRQQARVVFQYVKALLEGSALLRRLIRSTTRESIALRNGIDIEIHTASFRSTRGYTIVAFIGDEISFWRDADSANPDTEILTAIRPAMVTVPGALMLMISSPYSRRGALWQTYKKHFGVSASADVLVIQGSTDTFNPTVPLSVIKAAYEADHAAASAEYGAEFRRDIAAFVPLETVEACTVPGRIELPPVSGVRYFAFTDPSGGSSDSFTLAIAHTEKEGLTVLDAVRERKPPFSPDAVVSEFAELLKSYRVGVVQGDRYAGEWPRERFAVHGVKYEPHAKPKSELYAAMLPVLNSARVELLDVPRLAAQLVGLERRTTRAGKDTIDHAPKAHDDVANAVAGAVSLARRKSGTKAAPLGFPRASPWHPRMESETFPGPPR